MQNVNPGHPVQLALRADDHAGGHVGGSTDQPVEVKKAQTHQDDGQHAKAAGRLRQQLAQLLVDEARGHHGADDEEEVEVDHDGDAVVYDTDPVIYTP